MSEKKKGIFLGMTGVLIYVILSALGLTLIKMGTSQDCTLLLNAKGFTLQLNWVLIFGMFIYIVSFLTSMIVMKGMNLSIFYPLSAGLIYILICILSFVVLKEKISISKLVGMIIILAGIVIMNIGKGE